MTSVSHTLTRHWIKDAKKKKTKKKQLICIMYDQQENATQGVKNEF